MGGGRKFVVGLLAALLFFVVTTGGFLASLSGVITNKTYFKQVLGKEELYNGLARAVLEQPFQNVGDPTAAQAETPNVNQASLQKLLNQYFTPSWYKASVNTAVDGTYQWLEGKSDKPNFIISITGDKAGFQQFIIDTVSQQYNSLPACQTPPADVAEINPLDAKCKLASFNGGDVANYIRSGAQDKQFNDLFNNATLNSAELFGSLDPVTSRNLQRSYHTLSLMPAIFVVSVLGLFGLILLTVFSKQRGFKIAGLALLAPTVLGLIGTLLGWLARRHVIDSASPASSQGSDAMAQVARQTVSGLFGQVIHRSLIYGLALLGIALASLGTHWLFNRGSGSATKAVVAGSAAGGQIKK